MTDFMCFPQVPIHVASFGSLITLNPEFTTVFRTTTGVMEDCVIETEKNLIKSDRERNYTFMVTNFHFK